MISHLGFNLYLRDWYDMNTCLFIIIYSSLVRFLFVVTYLNWTAYFTCSCTQLNTQFKTIFSQSVLCFVFILLIWDETFWREKSFCLLVLLWFYIKFSFSVFPFMDLLFGVKSRSSVPCTRYPYISSSYFLKMCFSFNVMILVSYFLHTMWHFCLCISSYSSTVYWNDYIFLY